MSQHAALVPAYNPGDRLVGIARDLAQTSLRPIVVVDDGSRASCAAVFDKVAACDGVALLRHRANQGKGRAIKTGLAHLLAAAPRFDGVLTMDADGQHTVPDLLKVRRRLEREGRALVIGSRFGRADVPLRSRFGNGLTRLLFGVITGLRLRDTQTGLRGIPRELVPEIAALAGDRFEYEMQMLFHCAWRGIPVVEEPVETIYLGRNESSHFRPWRDSAIIYRLLLANWLRFARRHRAGAPR